MGKVLLIFVDGVGLAPARPDNPFATTTTPTLARVLGGPLTLEHVQRRETLCLVPLDACLGVAGLPQSATGQATLLTGRNAARRLGRHVPAFPGARLKRLIERHGIFRRAGEGGVTWTYANAFTARYWELLAARRLRKSASVLAVEAAAGALRSEDDYRAGRAISWDVLGDRLNSDGQAEMTASVAGRRLSRIARQVELTYYETHLTDLAGHWRYGLDPADVVRRLDGLLEGVFAEFDGTVVVTSDHGNLEQSSHRRHTRNPVPLLVVGPGARRFSRLRSLTGVCARVLSEVGVPADRR